MWKRATTEVTNCEFSSEFEMVMHCFAIEAVGSEAAVLHTATADVTTWRVSRCPRFVNWDDVLLLNSVACYICVAPC